MSARFVRLSCIEDSVIAISRSWIIISEHVARATRHDYRSASKGPQQAPFDHARGDARSEQASQAKAREQNRHRTAKGDGRAFYESYKASTRLPGRRQIKRSGEGDR